MLKHITTGQDVVDPLGLYLGDKRSAVDRPWVLLNMISSIDGATTLDGVSTGLGDEDDRTVFKALRAVPDYVLVGAGTVRAENYGPVRLDQERRRRRADAGFDEAPRLVIVTGRLNLEVSARVFSDPDFKPVVITGKEADPDRAEQLSEVAEVVILDPIDAGGIIGHLGQAGVILCEGGPSLNGQMLEAGMVDEINLTMAPILVSGESRRIAHGAPASPPLDMRLDRALMGDRSLFLRYLTK